MRYSTLLMDEWGFKRFYKKFCEKIFLYILFNIAEHVKLPFFLGGGGGVGRNRKTWDTSACSFVSSRQYNRKTRRSRTHITKQKGLKLMTRKPGENCFSKENEKLGNEEKKMTDWRVRQVFGMRGTQISFGMFPLEWLWWKGIRENTSTRSWSILITVEEELTQQMTSQPSHRFSFGVMPYLSFLASRQSNKIRPKYLHETWLGHWLLLLCRDSEMYSMFIDSNRTAYKSVTLRGKLISFFHYWEFRGKKNFHFFFITIHFFPLSWRNLLSK